MKTMKKYMKLLASLLVFFCFAQEFQGQNSQYRIIRSNLGSSGSSQTISTSNGSYHLSHSIGQSSVIGTHYNNGYYLRQGYQQPDSNFNLVKDFDAELLAIVYPNPFSEGLFISFSETIRNDISIQVFDIEGRIIHTQEFLPAQKVELQLPNISSGTYFLKVVSGRKFFNTKLIKI